MRAKNATHFWASVVPRWVAVGAIVGAMPLISIAGCSGDGGDSGGDRPPPKVTWSKDPPVPAGVRVGRRVPEKLARRPRFSRKPPPPGLRCAPDGVLREWRAAMASAAARKGPRLRWLEKPQRVATAKTYSGTQDLSAKLALASYSGGLSLAVVVGDDRHIPAKVPGAFGRADAVEVELWPDGAGSDARAKHPAVGVHLWLGSLRQLVRFERPAETWRQIATKSFGAELGAGWQIEARLPLSVLTPLPVPRVDRVRYRITIHDADAAGRSEPTLRFAGTAKLSPPLVVPEGVQRRQSIRICMADLPKRALWGYKNGWRCSIPYKPLRQPSSDTDPAPGYRFSHARLPSPPLLRYLKERLLLVNHPQLSRGVAGLISVDKRVVSLLELGIIGARDPGNPLTRSSDAEPLRLPDGTWAVAVTHAYPSRRKKRPSARGTDARDAERAIPPFGARCVAGHRVYLSILALRGAPHATPDNPPPKPDPPPHIEEVFRVKLEDCAAAQAYDWSISRDRRSLRVRDSIRPLQPARLYRYKNGAYRLFEAKEKHGSEAAGP